MTALALTGTALSSSAAVADSVFTVSAAVPFSESLTASGLPSIDSAAHTLVFPSGANATLGSLRAVDTLTGQVTTYSLNGAFVNASLPGSGVILDDGVVYSSSGTKDDNGDNRLTFTELATGEQEALTIPVADAAYISTLVFDAAHDRLYVQASENASGSLPTGVVVVDTSTRTIVGSVSGDYVLAGVDSANDRVIVRGRTENVAVITGDGTLGETLFVGAHGFGQNNVATRYDATLHKIVGFNVSQAVVFDVSSGQTSTVSGWDSSGTISSVVVDDANNIAYYAKSTTGTVTAVDLTDDSVIEVIDVGVGTGVAPRIALDQATNDLYIVGAATAAAFNGIKVVSGADEYSGGSGGGEEEPTPVAPEQPFTISGAEVIAGSLTWGVRESFRNYIVGPIAQGEITVSDGASRTDDGLIQFGAGAGVYDAQSQDTRATYSGSVRFYGHHGALDLTISDPTIVVKDRYAYLYADATDNTGKQYLNWPIAVIDLTSATRTVDGATTTYSAAPATLAEEAVSLFQEYAAGTALDPVTFSVTTSDAEATWSSDEAPASTVDPSAPSVTQQPASTAVGEGADATFTAAASGTPVPTVQWQSKLADAGDWVDIPNATDASYTATAVTAAASGTQYRAVFTNVAGTTATDAATLTVTALPSTGGGDDDGAGAGSGSGSSWSASEDDLTGVDQGGVSVPATATAGATILVTVGGDHQGETVSAYLFSTPISLGSHVVSAAGTISVTLPSDVTGDHRIAVYAADGTLIGWAPITITDPAALAATGGGFPAGVVWAGGILLLLGAAAVGAGIRRRHTT